MESIVFLDIDGVINSSENIQGQHALGLPTTGADIKIPEVMLLRVKRILEETQSYLVISSTWRKFKDHMRNLENQFGKVGVSINGTTDKTGMDRGYEILAYLRNNNLLGHPYIVIDDDSFDIEKYVPADNFIHTSGFIGLTDDQVERAIKSINDQKSSILGNITHKRIDVYETKEDAINAYSVYINTHINTVRFIFQKYSYSIIKYMVERYPDEADEWNKAFEFVKQKIKDHDKSKFSEEEFEGYRAYYYKSKEDDNKDIEDAYNKAWEHHYKFNSHHPEFWVVNLNETDKELKFIEMLKSCLLEMLCDWMSMSFQFNQSLYEWWFNSKNGREEKSKLLAANTFKLIDEFIIYNKETFNFSLK